MNICTPELAATSPAQLSAVFFEAPRRQGELRPVAPINVERPATPQERSAREEKQALRFAFALGLTSLVMWGVLFYTLFASLEVPSLL